MQKKPSHISSLVGSDAGVKYSKSEQRPECGQYFDFHHVEIWVSNTFQAKMFYETHLGFKSIAYSGLETGEKNFTAYVLQGDQTYIVVKSPLNPNDDVIAPFIKEHGDAVRDVAFCVEDVQKTFEHAKASGADVILAPTYSEDAHGQVLMASVLAYGDTVHSFIQREQYRGVFLPGYQPIAPDLINTLAERLPLVPMGRIDHVVANQPQGKMNEVVDFYINSLCFRRFWSVDDKLLQTGTSGLNSIVVSDFDERIKIPVNQPSTRFDGRSQTQEFVDFHGCGGIQHIAICVDNLEHTVRSLKARGCYVLPVPRAYYDELQSALSENDLDLGISIDTMRELDIVVDYDDKGFILQIFTRPVESRPTLFFEFMQRNNHDGFGAGNFKSLFSAIEAQQKLRGTL
ncbi:4-hydroxyphenylpyruvate dioxygenase [Vibrio zhanjiangensis]|uniref:4-hydroxyphenylpyruvate dioxygenase n=1 Tax=Vibrio zhanjiangensis TaxID=1046128 RepID=A0ABQ6EVB2_9VIBR|nr:4-hydroxyphenylpyruvate dioxygenase [Vibrio zhanjiangensis]GLT17016.1 4-hydroxyphenylpyruvate dioxygenase [Vibrio zhanjiangensis]